jgi:hypothetical protein
VLVKKLKNCQKIRSKEGRLRLSTQMKWLANIVKIGTVNDELEIAKPRR